MPNKATEDNLSVIKSYLPIFNGKKIITVATDRTTLSIKQVKDKLGDDLEYIHIQNSPLGETTNFLHMLEQVMSVSNDDIIFYGHTKGVTANSSSTEISVTRWRYEMYSHCLGRIKEVDQILTTTTPYVCCGCFKVGADFIYPEQIMVHHIPWHFSGSFFWINAKKLAAYNWKQIIPCRHGVEAYLGGIVPSEKAYCLEDTTGFFDKYNTTLSDWDMILRCYSGIPPTLSVPKFCMGQKFGTRSY